MLLNKKFIIVLIMLALPMIARGYSNKAYLQPRTEAVNAPLKYTTFYEMVDQARLCGSYKDEKSTIKPFWGGTFQLVPFYQESEHSSRTGQYFGLHGKNQLRVRTTAFDAITNVHPNTTIKGIMNDIDFAYLVHSATMQPDNVTMLEQTYLSVAFQPKQTVYGGTISYYQLFDRVIKNLFVFAHVPVVRQEREAHASVTAISLDAEEKVIYANAMASFFAGTLEGPAVLEGDEAVSRGQVKMTNVKFAGKKLTSDGFSDIDCGFGYLLFNKPTFQLSLALGLTVPICDHPKGEFVFEPVRGNGGHIGFGGNLDGWVKIHECGKQRAVLLMKNEVRYLFQSREMRTVGIKGHEWGHYYALGKVGQAELVPAANVLTLKNDVTPGFQYDGMFGFMYENSGWTAELGYNLYAREQEKVRLSSVFPENTYAIAARGHVTAVQQGAVWLPKPFVIEAATVDGGDVAGAIVNASTIDTGVAQTPAQCTNGIYGSFGYIINSEPDALAIVSVGGAYEWAAKNSALEQWGVWGKLGLAF